VPTVLLARIERRAKAEQPVPTIDAIQEPVLEAA
jgi:hypothetical protein